MVKINDSMIEGKEKFPFGAESLSNRFIYEVLPDNSWKGKPCIIVGGGPSLKEFDWNLLRGWRTIGINRVYERHDPTIIFSMDTRFLRWIDENKYGTEAKEKFIRSKAYKVWLCTYNCKLSAEIYIVKVWENYSRGFRVFTNSMHKGIGHGNNSGYGALNLAFCLGANPIYLLGYDMRYVKTDPNDVMKYESHWHEGHPQPHKPNTVEGFRQYYTIVQAITKEAGVEVINLCPSSALTVFKKIRYEEVLK